MIDPEAADGLIGVGQGIAVNCQRMSEIGRVKVHADVPGSCPVDPALEVFGKKSITLDLATARLGIAGVKVQTMRAG